MPKERNFLKRIVIYSFLIVFYILIILIGGEIILRIFSPQILVTPMYTIGENGLNYSLKPNIDGWIKAREFGNIKIKINSQGIREKEIAYETLPWVYRILILGDSTTFGWAVDKEKRFSDVLESQLNQSDFYSKHYFKKVEVINCGVGGYGTADELKFFTAEGIKYKPNMVILAFGGDDSLDSVNSKLYEIENDRLKPANGKPLKFKLEKQFVDLIPFYKFLCENSHLVNFLRRNYIYIKNRILTKGSLYAQQENSKDKWQLTYLLFKELKDVCKKNNSELLICELPFLPTAFDYKMLHDICNKLNINLVKHPYIIAEEDVFKKDGHLNVKGHKKLGDSLANYIITRKEEPLHINKTTFNH